MKIADHLLQPSIPAHPRDPGRPFEGFGWPAVLHGPIAAYDYPEHTGPLSVNFCFGGILSTREKDREWCADSSTFCIAPRTDPTTVRTLTSGTARQLAFFYSPSAAAGLLPPGEASGPPPLSLLRPGTYPLAGPVRRLVDGFLRRLASPSLTDETVEEMHAGLFGTLATALNPGLFRPWSDPSGGASGSTSDLDRRLQLAREHIDLDPVTPRSLDDRAAAVGLSKFHYLRQFKKRYHTTPGQYVVARKVALARLLLAAGDHRVEEICRLLRYRSPSHFAAVFREATGVSPKHYQLLPFTPGFRREARRRLADEWAGIQSKK